jgi:CRP-like cAMP-binding protein
MRKVLYILGQLDDVDIDWLARYGQREVLRAGNVLIRQGVPTPYLYIVLDGSLDVSVNGVGSVARLLSGEIIGEMSFVDSAPPSATVSALSEAVVLSVPKDDLEEKIHDEPMFGLRFYKALALFLADRLRNAQRGPSRNGKASASGEEVEADELDEKLLDAVAMAGDRFDRLVKAVSRD